MSTSNYLQSARLRAAEFARRLHADVVSREHLICALLADEQSAICELVEHAFADPETLYEDALALAPGILIVGSAGARPFSVRAVLAARSAVDTAREAGLASVTSACILRAAFAELPEGAQAALQTAGCDPSSIALSGEQGDLPAGTHLFHPFSDEARRALTGASRLAANASRNAISPADLIAGALGEDRDLARALGMDKQSAVQLLRPFADDTTPPDPQELREEEDLSDLFTSLPADACSLDALDRILAQPEAELAQVFLRQKVTPALLERSRESFVDP